MEEVQGEIVAEQDPKELEISAPEKIYSLEEIRAHQNAEDEYYNEIWLNWLWGV